MNYSLFSYRKILSLSSLDSKKELKTVRKYSSVDERLDDLFFKSQLAKPKKLLSEDYIPIPKEFGNENCQFRQVITSGLSGLYQVIAILCTNSDIIIHFSLFKKFDPDESISQDDDELLMNGSIIHVIHYFKAKPLACIAIEDNGKTLVCITEDREVYLMPICRICFPSQSLNNWPFKTVSKVTNMVTPKSKVYPSLMSYLSNPLERKSVNYIEELKEIGLCSTKKISSKIQGTTMTSCVFWKTFDQQSFVIVGTDKGHIIFFNLSSQNVDHTLSGFEEIKKFDIVIDVSCTYKYLLIHADKGHFYRVILEQYDSEFLHFKLVTTHQSDVKTFAVEKLEFSKEFPCKISVYYDKRKGPLICVQKKTYISIYDSDSCKLILYQYQMKNNLDKFHNTDSLLLISTGEMISVVSKLLAVDEIKNESIFQQFACEEGISGFLKDYRENEIEGSFIWTNSALYELVQESTPKEMFNVLLRKNVIPNYKLEEFGKTFSLNILKLYEKTADEMYEKEEYDLAMHYYKSANTSESKYVKKLLKLGQMNTINEYLGNLLKNPTSLTLQKKKELTSLLYHVYMHQYSNGSLKKDVLHSFLITHDFAKEIIPILVQKGLLSTAVQISTKSDTLDELYELILGDGIHHLVESDLESIFASKSKIPDELIHDPKFSVLFQRNYQEIAKLSQEDIVSILTLIDPVSNKSLTCLLLIHLNHLKKTTIKSSINHLLYTFSQEKLNENLVNTPEILLECVKTRNFSSLAKLYEMNELHVESLFCKLKSEDSEFKILKTFEEYLSRPNLSKTTSLIFQVWAEFKFPVTNLEEFCLKHMGTLCETLVQIVKNLCPLEFTQKFYLKLNLQYIKNLKRNYVNDIELEKQIFSNMKDAKLSLVLPIRTLKKCVIFSCGHKYDPNDFERLILDTRTKIKSLVKSDDENPQIISDAYINTLISTCLSEDYLLYKRGEIMSNACPNCVLSYRLDNGEF